jgi:hypothetical protein
MAASFSGVKSGERNSAATMDPGDALEGSPLLSQAPPGAYAAPEGIPTHMDGADAINGAMDRMKLLAMDPTAHPQAYNPPRSTLDRKMQHKQQ